MVNVVVLSNEKHRNIRISKIVGSEYTRQHVVSVVPREFQHVIAHYPIFFTKSSDSGQFEPAALLGFERGENLFLENGGWDAGYVPMQIQRQPFSVVPRQNDSATGQPSSLDIAIDDASPLLAAGDGERLFLEDGKATPYLSSISQMLSMLVQGSRESYQFTAKLTELNLIEPVKVEVEFVNRSNAKLQGLNWIAAAALKALPAAQLADLRDNNYLEWMYFQMASLSQMANLVARKNRRISSAAAALSEAPSAGNA